MLLNSAARPGSRSRAASRSRPLLRCDPLDRGITGAAVGRALSPIATRRGSETSLLFALPIRRTRCPPPLLPSASYAASDPKDRRLGHGRDSLPFKDKPHRLLFEFQGVPCPNQSRHLKPSKADPTQSALGDAFRRRNQDRTCPVRHSQSEAPASRPARSQ